MIVQIIQKYSSKFKDCKRLILIQNLIIQFKNVLKKYYLPQLHQRKVPTKKVKPMKNLAFLLKETEDKEIYCQNYIFRAKNDLQDIIF